ncbi:MAG: hypothetical protein WCA35_26880 [Kovacikia sp.]
MNLFQPDRPKILTEPVMAIVDVSYAPHSIRVKYAATTWNAKFHNLNSVVALFPGQSVKVVGIQGITLLIEV